MIHSLRREIAAAWGIPENELPDPAAGLRADESAGEPAECAHCVIGIEPHRLGPNAIKVALDQAPRFLAVADSF